MGIREAGTAEAGETSVVGKEIQREVAWECYKNTSLYRSEFFPARGLFVDTRGLRPKQEASSE